MLLFACKPDKVFTAILHKALERARAELQELLLDPEEFRVLYPNIGRCFDPDTALSTIKQLLRASRSAKLYELTDYHWLILHEVLRVFADAHNDFVQDDPAYDTQIGAYHLSEIDFDDIVDRFFGDLPFTPNGRPTRKEDLQIMPVEDSDWTLEPDDPDHAIFQSDSVKYPDLREG